MSCEIYREYARNHYQGDKARAIRDENRTTGRSNFSRVCEKCRLERDSAGNAHKNKDEIFLGKVSFMDKEARR